MKKRKLYLDTSILGFALNRYDLLRQAEANRQAVLETSGADIRIGGGNGAGRGQK